MNPCKQIRFASFYSTCCVSVNCNRWSLQYYTLCFAMVVCNLCTVGWGDLVLFCNFRNWTRYCRSGSRILLWVQIQKITGIMSDYSSNTVLFNLLKNQTVWILSQGSSSRCLRFGLTVPPDWATVHIECFFTLWFSVENITLIQLEVFGNSKLWKAINCVFNKIKTKNNLSIFLFLPRVHNVINITLVL